MGRSIGPTHGKSLPKKYMIVLYTKNNIKMIKISSKNIFFMNFDHLAVLYKQMQPVIFGKRFGTIHLARLAAAKLMKISMKKKSLPRNYMHFVSNDCSF